ncbi:MULTISPECIES: TonB-dependent receptor [unclassified Parabacteroides]|uniref:TonB-dependent receptor n=1 Tax=unclassified Parabacteroides TaxID=2649774 RepID=UPI0024754443|nr:MULTISPECIES: TonB-dependent receptor [unclassified Parabacteroides]
MRLTVILSLLTIFCASAVNGYSQKAEISLNLQDVTLEQALNAVKQQSEYSFWYRNEEINLDKLLSVHIEKQPINNVMDNLLADQGVNYTIDDKHIIIYKKAGESSNVPARQQDKRITGVIVDESNLPIIGANVIVKGTSLGTITDIDGKFSLEVPVNAILQVSYIGYTSKEVAVGNQSTLRIILEEDSKTIDEVVIIGYGSVKKSNLTGAVSSIKTTELQQTPITSIDQGLAGRASGVQVTQTSGMPGAVASIRVRGSSSLQGGNEPLYVIDGFPVYSGGGFGETGGKSQMSGLATVNPGDIESIEILKDASATAIYGARAANGVVLVTTKSGKKGRDIVTFESSWGIQSVAKKIDLMNAQEYAALINEAYTNDGLSPYYNATQLAEIAKLGKGTDWQDELFRTALTQSYQLSFSGGDEKTTYAISGGYFDQEGIIINSEFKRYSLRLNLDRQMSKTFKVGTHMSGSHTISKSPPTDVGDRLGVITGAMKMSPIQPIYENEETGEYTQMNIPGLLIANPIATAKEQIYDNATTRVLGDVYAEWEFLPNFKAKVSVGTDVMYLKANHYTPSNIYQAMGTATATINTYRSINWLNENILTWNKTINDIHDLSVLGGFTIQRNNVETVKASSKGFVNDVMKYNNLGAASTYLKPESSATQWSIMSYLARVNYSLYDKYLFSVNARIDGSSRFGDNNKYGFFPSGSFAWRLSEEEFMEATRSVISNLKLRTSYGFTGNTEIGVYESLATLGNNNWTIGNGLVSGFYPNRIPNPDLKWEKTGQFDLGIDVGFVDNRFRITADYYRKKTTDLLYNVAIPNASGYSSMLKNIGSVENKGVELSLESDNVTGIFNWTTAFNISFNRNKVLELGGEEYKEMDEGDGHLKTGSIRRLVVGKPIGVFYGYRFDGIFQNEAECAEQISSASPIGVGLRRYKDLNGDNKVDANNDREILGDSNPKFFGGLTNTFGYKGFELNVFLQYSYGNKIFNYNAMELEAPTGGQNVYKDLVNRWTPTNPSNEYAKASTNRNLLVSDRFVEDGSYLKLKTLSLSYSFPNLKFKHIGGLRLYVTAQNLLTWTDYRGYDPEVSYRGASTLEAGEDFGGYPQSRTYMFGVKIDIK